MRNRNSNLDSSPKVSVIVVNWNGGAFLEHCLSALYKQTTPPNEILVVDNASSDGSRDIIERFPGTKLLAQDSNTGFSKANNTAVKAASSTSDWLALLNPDAVPAPDWLERLVDAAKDEPQFDAFGSRLVDANNPNLLDGMGDAYHMSGLVWRTGKDSPASESTDSVTEVFSACAAATLYRRSAFEGIGGFDEDFFCYVEDVDLGFRLRLAGHRSLYVPKSVARHIGSATSGGQHSDFAVYHGHRNLVWTFVKNMPSVLLWVFLPVHILMNLVTIVWFTSRGQGRIIVRAKRDALLGLPLMLHKRKSIQKTRKASIIDIWRVLDKRLFPLKR